MNMAIVPANARTIGDVEGVQKKVTTQTSARKWSHTVRSAKENMSLGTLNAQQEKQ